VPSRAVIVQIPVWMMRPETGEPMLQGTVMILWVMVREGNAYAGVRVVCAQQASVQ